MPCLLTTALPQYSTRLWSPFDFEWLNDDVCKIGSSLCHFTQRPTHHLVIFLWIPCLLHFIRNFLHFVYTFHSHHNETKRNSKYALVSVSHYMRSSAEIFNPITLERYIDPITIVLRPPFNVVLGEYLRLSWNTLQIRSNGAMDRHPLNFLVNLTVLSDSRYFHSLSLLVGFCFPSRGIVWQIESTAIPQIFPWRPTTTWNANKGLLAIFCVAPLQIQTESALGVMAEINFLLSCRTRFSLQ